MSLRGVVDQVKGQGAARKSCFDATVDVFNVQAGTVSVTIQPEDIQAEGLQYHTPLPAGPWKLIALPAAGAMVKVIASDPEMINADTAYVVGGQWDEDNAPPDGYAAGDYLLMNQDGTSKFHLKADGSAEFFGEIKLGDDSAITLANSLLLANLEATVTKLVADMALLVVHTHGVIADPTLLHIGGYSIPDGTMVTTKVKGS